MRHGKTIAKLGRTSSHRKALMKNLATNLLKREKITTTIDKAKAIRPYVEKLITRAKESSVHNKREAAKKIQDRTVLIKLFDDIGPRFKERNGGYTRIMRLGLRPGDAAEMAIIELVVQSQKEKKKSDKKKKAEKEEAPAAT
ncbi:MAG TPA: 50S ribosomal protein L17 [Spirochaetota bacterium]|nr:50S ribosomal protein L17 [Spirochaetota bacterium]HPH02241.1 50S ribosomal protein L17 [Spirochaetota bacterium]